MAGEHSGTEIFGLDEETGRYVIIAFCAVLILFAGTMSGLTLSLFSLDVKNLEIIAKSGSPSDRVKASNLLPFLREPHWLLVSLLLGNACAVETMPLFFSRLMSPFLAVALSTVFILLFGEIIPQALFVRFALTIGSTFRFFLRGLMIVTGVISYPIAKLLDCLVGHRQSVFFRRREIRAFILLQQELAAANHSDSDDDDDNSEDDSSESSANSDELTKQEISMMLGALVLSEQTVGGCMKTTIDSVVMLPENEPINSDLVNRLFNTGFSRIPIYRERKNQIVSYLLVKQLLQFIYCNEEDAPKTVGEMTSSLWTPIYQPYDVTLNDLYVAFQSGGAHLAVVTASEEMKDMALGIITLEDVLEKIHGCRIEDETDLESRAPAQMIVRDWHERRRIERRSVTPNPVPMSIASGGSGSNCGGSFDNAATPLMGRGSKQRARKGSKGGQAYRDPTVVVDYGANQPTSAQKQPTAIRQTSSHERGRVVKKSQKVAAPLGSPAGAPKKKTNPGEGVTENNSFGGPKQKRLELPK